MLADISANYYLRLEQRRDSSPSHSILESLAGVLRLDDETTYYLLSLGEPQRRRQRRKPRRESVPSGVVMLVTTFPLPAFVEGRSFEDLAANSPATGLSPRLAVGCNRLRDVFLDPAEKVLYPDWERAPSDFDVDAAAEAPPADDVADERTAKCSSVTRPA